MASEPNVGHSSTALGTESSQFAGTPNSGNSPSKPPASAVGDDRKAEGPTTVPDRSSPVDAEPELKAAPPAAAADFEAPPVSAAAPQGQEKPAITPELNEAPVATPAQEQPSAKSAAGSDTRSSVPPTPGGPSRMPGLPSEEDVSNLADDEDPLPDPAELAALSDSRHDELQDIHVGEICSGVVVSIGPGGVIIDIGRKTEGLAPIEDFQDRAGDVVVKEGQEIEVFVESRGMFGEYAALSYRRAQQSRIWTAIEAAESSGEPIQAEVTGRVKGGLAVNIGISAFLPGSQVDLQPTHDLDALIGQTLTVRVVKSNQRRGNVVVSRRSLLEEERDRIKKQTLEKIEEGAVITGTVKNVTDYGAFVDLGGIDGLIHVTDISYGRIKGPSEVLKKGQEINAKVLHFDKEKEKVSLSLKHLKPDPWDGVTDRYKTGEKVTGKVASTSDYGVFVELETGVEGLVHSSELTWSRRRRHPSKLYKPGDSIEVMVLGVKTEERRISISVKQLRPDPWSNLEDRLPMGTIVDCRVRNLASYGAFLEVEEGVDGLIHVSDLSWDQKAKNPQDVLKKGEAIRAVVLRIDRENRRLSLGLKQLQPNVWEAFFSTCTLGEIVTGRVTRKAKFGCFVELAEGVEGLCHNLEMPKGSGGKKKGLEIGRSYSFRVVKLEEFERKIGLSRRNVEDLASKPESTEVAAAV